MEYIIVILSIIILVLSYMVWNLLKKSEVTEDELEFSQTYIDLAYNSMKNAYERMVRIDRLGSFEADDESGYIFGEIKSAMDELNEVYNLDGETENE
jgi:hypothetical protein